MGFWIKIIILFGVVVSVLSACTQIEVLPKGPANFVSGQLAKFESELSLASYYFEEALLEEPDNESVLQQAFTLALMNGYNEKAITIAEKIDEIGARNPSVSMILALDSFKKRDFKKVNYFLGKTKGTGFETLISPILKAWVRGLENEPIKALEELEALKKISLFQSFGAEHAAYIMDYMGNDGAAEKAYLSLLSSNQLANIDPIFSYGAFLSRINRKADALNIYNSFYKALPANRNLRDAIERLEKGIQGKSVAHNPDLAIGLALLRVATELSRDSANRPALLYAQLGLFMAPTYETGLLLIANLFIASEQPQSALDVLKKIPTQNNYSDIARIRESLAWNELGDEEKAISVLRNYLSIDSGNRLIHSSLGDTLRGHERFEEAIIEYNLALKKVSGNPQNDWFLYFARGICYEQIGDWPKAEADFNKALEIKPNDPQVLNYLGYSWIDRGLHFEKARGMIEEAVKQSPTDGFIVDSLGWAQFLMGEYDEAVITLEKAVKLQPNDSTLNNHLGDAYWMVGRRLEARFQWNHAIMMGPEPDEIELLEQKLSFGLMALEANVKKRQKVNN